MCAAGACLPEHTGSLPCSATCLLHVLPAPQLIYSSLITHHSSRTRAGAGRTQAGAGHDACLCHLHQQPGWAGGSAPAVMPGCLQEAHAAPVHTWPGHHTPCAASHRSGPGRHPAGHSGACYVQWEVGAAGGEAQSAVLGIAHCCAAVLRQHVSGAGGEEQRPGLGLLPILICGW